MNNLPPLLEAQILGELQQRHGTQVAVANRIGKTNGYVSQRLALLNLVPELRESVQAGELNLDRARQVARVPQSRQADELIRLQGEQQQDHRNGFYSVKAGDTGRAIEEPQDGTVEDDGAGPQRRDRTSKSVPVEQRARQLRREYTPDQCRQLAELVTVD